MRISMYDDTTDLNEVEAKQLLDFSVRLPFTRQTELEVELAIAFLRELGGRQLKL